MASLDTKLERLLADDYLEGATGRSLEEIRIMRAECQEAETALSYLRRIAQGRLDIVRVYLERPADASVDLPALVDRLPEIMSGPPRPSGTGRLPSHMAPDLESDLTDEVDAVLDTQLVTELPDLGREELRELADRLGAIERRASDQRRALHERIDKLQAEIVSRYKRGEATVEGLLA